MHVSAPHQVLWDHWANNSQQPRLGTHSTLKVQKQQGADTNKLWKASLSPELSSCLYLVSTVDYRRFKTGVCTGSYYSPIYRWQGKLTTTKIYIKSVNKANVVNGGISSLPCPRAWIVMKTARDKSSVLKDGDTAICSCTSLNVMLRAKLRGRHLSV